MHSTRVVAILLPLLSFSGTVSRAVDAPTPATVEDWAPTTIPPNAKDLLPILDEVLAEMWPELQDRAVIAAQIEQETCLDTVRVDRQKKCWSPLTEIKTEREYYFGLGGLTVAYDENGKEKASVFEEVKKLDPSLASWKWEDRFDPKMQLRAVVALDREMWKKIKFDVADDRERTAFMLAAYNGGLGHVVKDRKLCQTRSGCDPTKWFGNVESESVKSKTVLEGFSASFFDINRAYVTRVMDVRAPKYRSALASKTDKQQP